MNSQNVYCLAFKGGIVNNLQGIGEEIQKQEQKTSTQFTRFFAQFTGYEGCPVLSSDTIRSSYSIIVHGAPAQFPAPAQFRYVHIKNLNYLTFRQYCQAPTPQDYQRVFGKLEENKLKLQIAKEELDKSANYKTLADYQNARKDAQESCQELTRTDKKYDKYEAENNERVIELVKELIEKPDESPNMVLAIPENYPNGRSNDLKGLCTEIKHIPSTPETEKEIARAERSRQNASKFCEDLISQEEKETAKAPKLKSPPKKEKQITDVQPPAVEVTYMDVNGFITNKDGVPITNQTIKTYVS